EKDQFSVLVKIIIPSAIPSIFTGLRLGIGSAWTCVVAAEMIAASAGIGYLISYGRELAQPDVLLVGIVTIGIVGIVLDILMRWLEKKLIFWNDVK
ncbi:MAG: ABC transporter permease subunit, partial [Lachnospiraceae bacterium]|nr:ABC transporter permease subunit [Lachnospiraceae bacterium]